MVSWPIGALWRNSTWAQHQVTKLKEDRIYSRKLWLNRQHSRWPIGLLVWTCIAEFCCCDSQRFVLAIITDNVQCCNCSNKVEDPHSKEISSKTVLLEWAVRIHPHPRHLHHVDTTSTATVATGRCADVAVYTTEVVLSVPRSMVNPLCSKCVTYRYSMHEL